jgi:hypothetical protein
MGLDMMLNRKIDNNEYGEIGYWRKANAIHSWFVRNVQNGVDDCDSYLVTKDKLKSLLMACELVLHTPAMSSTYLPTTSGFFFGNTEYDQNYISDIKRTIEIVKEAIEDEYETYYSSSW